MGFLAGLGKITDGPEFHFYLLALHGPVGPVQIAPTKPKLLMLSIFPNRPSTGPEIH